MASGWVGELEITELRKGGEEKEKEDGYMAVVSRIMRRKWMVGLIKSRWAEG